VQRGSSRTGYFCTVFFTVFHASSPAFSNVVCCSAFQAKAPSVPNNRAAACHDCSNASSALFFSRSNLFQCMPKGRKVALGFREAVEKYLIKLEKGTVASAASVPLLQGQAAFQHCSSRSLARL